MPYNPEDIHITPMDFGKAAVTVMGVSKRFGEASVLDNINFSVNEDEIVVLLGASGSGKTTILRIIAGLEMPDSGMIILHGKNVTELPARQRGTGVIFQSYALFPKMTVEHNIGYGLKIRRRKRKEIREKVDQLIELVDLGEHRKKYPSQLSGGQQQRVAIARAIVGQPRILLADEPTGNLDSQMGDEIMAILKDLNSRERTTIVMVTHDKQKADATHRILRLFDGRQVN